MTSSCFAFVAQSVKYDSCIHTIVFSLMSSKVWIYIPISTSVPAMRGLCLIEKQTQLASCQICKIAGCACAGNAGNVFPTTVGWWSRHASWHVRDARAVMHAGIANWRFHLKSVVGKTFLAFPAHAQPAILGIWHKAHVSVLSLYCKCLPGCFHLNVIQKGNQ